MSDFKIKVLRKFRCSELNNKFSFEFAQIKRSDVIEYAVYSHFNGVTRCCKIGTDYREVREYFKSVVLANS